MLLTIIIAIIIIIIIIKLPLRYIFSVYCMLVPPPLIHNEMLTSDGIVLGRRDFMR
jgi:hypothetical protein